MAEREPYSRVYWSIHGDPKFTGMTYPTKGVWLDLLLIADMAYPAPAHLPMGVPMAAVKDLSQRGLILLLPGHTYGVKGLESERGRRAEAARIGAAARWPQSTRTPPALQPDTERTPDGMPRRDETSRDTPSQDATTRAPEDERWDEPEAEALTFLAQHGCYLAPGNGFHRKLVLMVEQHGVGSVLRTMNLLARHGTENGDTKGFIFGADDALRKRPDLKAVKADEIAAIDHAKSERLQAETRHLTEEQERLAASTPMKPLRDLLPRPS